MSNANHAARDFERTRFSRDQNKPADSYAAKQGAPRAAAPENHVLGAGRAVFRAFWGDLVTLLSLGVCAWFLAQMVYQLLHG